MSVRPTFQSVRAAANPCYVCSRRRRYGPPRAKPQRRVASGIVWIAVLTVLLGGIVAVNVAVLRLNIRLDQLGQERAKLRADNASLAAQLSSATAAARTEAAARRELHLVPAQAQNTYYVNLASR